ncbi:IS1634 family transposase, partial [Bacillus sp. 2205SS5-2]|uniref:IS1634 family transposase n=1 Tax=Bacillus sp. 2205SS5-2 TaxID=3109031 RepID=UPI0030077FF3
MNVALDTLHCDTTSFSVSGDYLPDSSSSGLSEKEPLSVTYGYSKQKRPDLKQIVLGMGVPPQRIPIVAKVENGNTSDVKWNMEFVQKLRETLSEEDWSNLLYQADSALISKGNLQDLAAHQLDFLSRLPDTFRLSTELKSKAWKNNKWEVIGELTSQTNGSNYRYQAFEEELEGRLYRFLVVHSSQLEKQKVKRIEADIQKEHVTLTNALDKLADMIFHCEADAEKARIAFEKKHKTNLHEYQLTIEIGEEPIKCERRGRPKKDEVTQTATVYRVRLSSLEENQGKIDQKLRLLSTFILMTNRMDRSRLSDVDMLTTYKGQSAAETRFRLLKDAQMIDAVFVKTPERIEALGIVYVMALLIYGMLEYRIRAEMKKQEEPLILMGKRKLFEPTGQALLEQLNDVR